jgi:hypothetical protein
MTIIILNLGLFISLCLSVLYHLENMRLKRDLEKKDKQIFSLIEITKKLEVCNNVSKIIDQN